MAKKYYVKRESLTTGETEYQKCKTLDIWVKDKSICWQFSKQGAENIAKRYADREYRWCECNFSSVRSYIYGTESV